MPFSPSSTPKQLTNPGASLGICCQEETSWRRWEQALHLQAEGHAVAGGEAQLAEGDGHLGGPTPVVDDGGRVPDRVPGGILAVAVAREGDVGLDAGGVDLEAEGGALVEVAVDQDGDAVAVELVAARDAAHDAGRLAVVAAHQQIEVPVVVHHLELGGLARHGAAVGLALGKIAAPPGFLPAGVVAAAVDLRRVRVDMPAHVDPLLRRETAQMRPSRASRSENRIFFMVILSVSWFCQHSIRPKKRKKVTGRKKRFGVRG